VGDSVQQNGVFKIRLTLIKQKLIELRSEKQMAIELLPFDIIPIVNYGWMDSFQVKKMSRVLKYEPDMDNDLGTFLDEMSVKVKELGDSQSKERM
jgi:hypothetical protein